MGKDARRAQVSFVGISFFLYGGFKAQILLCHTARLQLVTDSGAPAEYSDIFTVEVWFVE